MNDFTKDELMFLCIQLKSTYLINDIKNPYHRSLQDKIQSMIDNFHSYLDYIEKSQIDCERYGCENYYEKCSKCGAIFL